MRFSPTNRSTGRKEEINGVGAKYGVVPWEQSILNRRGARSKHHSSTSCAGRSIWCRRFVDLATPGNITEEDDSLMLTDVEDVQ